MENINPRQNTNVEVITEAAAQRILLEMGIQRGIDDNRSAREIAADKLGQACLQSESEV